MVYFFQLYQRLISRRYNGRGDRIRTCDPLVPNQMRYQAAPLPDLGYLSVAVVGPAGLEPATKPL